MSIKSETGDRHYRGRLAPSPSGYLHLGHALTFWTAQERARKQAGTLILRNEDLDRARCKPEFVAAMIEDLRWFGCQWQEGPDCGGPYGPYTQSEREHFYRDAFEKLRADGFLYPCACSRKDVLRALQAPHEGEDEPIYPGTCRDTNPATDQCQKTNWRFRVPDGETVSFEDGCQGRQEFIAGKDFGDFVVWSRDDLSAYQLAAAIDDAAMRISEVVRGADLLKSTARQLLLGRALGLAAPAYYHCDLVTDEFGIRLAKRHDALSLRALRARGFSPEEVRKMANARTC